MLLVAVMVLSPVGLEIIAAAFLSGEALSRNIWGPIVLTGGAVMILVGLLEWWIRKSILHRRARGKGTV
jgi:hypothetical protein